MRSLGVLTLAAAATGAHALVVDNFQSGPYDSGWITNMGVGVNDSQSGPTSDIVGGIRDTNMLVLANPLGANGGARMTIGGGILTLTQAEGTLGSYSVFWGKPGAYLNKNLSNQTGFKFTLFSNTVAPFQLNVRAATAGFGPSNAFITIPVTSTSRTVIVPFSSFSGNVHWNDVDAIRFFINPTASGDVSLGMIETVPEPGTMVALALGAFALLKKRR